jgi:hypothetical protein
MLRCLRVDVNMCLSIPQIGGLAFSLLFRSSEINFLACRRRSSFPMAALGPGIGRCSRERMLVRRRWIYRSFPTSSMGCGGSWSKVARGRSPIDVPQQHVPCCLQRACSSTHKALLAMVEARRLFPRASTQR